GIAGHEVYVTQWYRDNGAWVQNMEFGTAEEGSPAASRVTRTGEGGVYEFADLPTYVQMKDGRPLAPVEGDGDAGVGDGAGSEEPGESGLAAGDDDFRLAAYRISVA